MPMVEMHTSSKNFSTVMILPTIERQRPCIDNTKTQRYHKNETKFIPLHTK